MKIFYYFFTIIIAMSNVAKANIIRDSEIEEAVSLVIKPLKKVSGLNDLKIYIINDTEPNAFTAGGDEVFISSGLITNYPDPDVLRGVVAHEIGHILGQHISRRQEVIDNYKKAAIASTALGLATAMGGGAAEGLAIAMGGAHVSERSIYAYSRTFESSADQTALKLLEKSGHSSIGLIKFFEGVKRLSANRIFNVYDQTHPLSDERLLIARSFNKRSRFSNSQDTDQLVYKYVRSAAKLAAFTLDTDKVLDYKFAEQSDEIERYVKAIRCFRLGKFDDALNHINFLLIRHPDDPYYHELKAQIYFEAGKKAALHEYELAEQQKPDDVLIRLGKAIVGMTGNMDNSNPRVLDKYYKDLLFVVERDPDNLLALHYMAIYYEKTGLIGKGYLNTALISLKSGRTADAAKMAAAAMKILPKNSPDWYKAGDILAATK
ncbi:MAG: M48 family metalloprotease [Rickettsiaceae bacterium]